MPYTSRSRSWTLRAVGAVIIAASGCECPECPPCPPAHEAQDTVLKNRMLPEAQLLEYQREADTLVTECPEVCGFEYDAISRAFKDQFKIKNADNTYSEILAPSVSVPWSEFANKVEGKSPASEPRAVLYHYGLGASDELVLGISVVLLTRTANPDVWEFDTTKADFYIVEAHKLKSHPRSDWAPYHKRYFSRVHVERTAVAGDMHVPLVPACDHRYYGMPWEVELMWLGRHNPVPAGTNVVFTHAATEYPGASHGACAGYQHVVCAHIEGALTNNPSPEGEFYAQRGADLGTPCPPRCGKIDIADLIGNCGQRVRCQAGREMLHAK